MHLRQPQRQFRSPSEVAHILGTHRATVFRWARAGVLPRPVYLTPHKPVFRRAEIDAWLAERAAEREGPRGPGAPTRTVEVS
jgi:predicted DNA-binding transcriptional regulator AlpA